MLEYVLLSVVLGAFVLGYIIVSLESENRRLKRENGRLKRGARRVKVD